MARRQRKRNNTMTAALLAATVAASLAFASGCTTPDGRLDNGRENVPDGTDSGSPETGTPRTGSPLAVKIDNVPGARPQTGLDAADIVYAEQVEGGLSRLMAVYATKLPKTIGPVRSARESDLELLRQFNDPTLAFSGAQGKLLPLIDKAPLHPASPADAGKAYYRGSDKPTPHNLYLRPQRLLAATPGADALTTGFRYGAAPEGGKAELTRTVRFPAARFTFDWSKDRQRWLVSMDGTPTVTTDGKRVAASTVVVQYVEVRKSAYRDFLGNNTPYTKTVGSGTAKVLRDGKVFDADWKRPAAADGTEFTTTNGTPLNFAKGQVWVVFTKA
ncbi:DUF3048 domain-containing protein [Streptomyces sp. NBC_00878]|uniref:DUF3048 domain-containing protein n=1 Tax=Streptomyces sp. NBC_00878 TaxID=2975854 RepID=UPI00225C0673|nr:DUF3048 domain-containing protein [Streptomyces sp. NBC_00878]MCX4903693.1 DUF3048 domain-containing protein [Streptomyces sp. NBC_00878]